MKAGGFPGRLSILTLPPVVGNQSWAGMESILEQKNIGNALRL
jgi:hypothetical protein